MDDTILRHGFGIKDQQILKVKYDQGRIDIYVRTKDKSLKCSGCGSKEVLRKGYTERSFLTNPIGLNAVHLVAQVQRLECKACGLVRQERLSYADPKKSYTHCLEKYINDLLRSMTVTDVAANLGMSWNTVKGIQTNVLKLNTTTRYNRR